MYLCVCTCVSIVCTPVCYMCVWVKERQLIIFCCSTDSCHSTFMYQSSAVQWCDSRESTVAYDLL